jgi:hypothetical protein
MKRFRLRYLASPRRILGSNFQNREVYRLLRQSGSIAGGKDDNRSGDSEEVVVRRAGLSLNRLLT